MIGAQFAPNIPVAQKSFWTHPIVALGDEEQVEARARFASNIPLAQKSFWTHSMERLGDVGHLDSHFFPFGDNVSVDAR